MLSGCLHLVVCLLVAGSSHPDAFSCPAFWTDFALATEAAWRALLDFVRVAVVLSVGFCFLVCLLVLIVRANVFPSCRKDGAPLTQRTGDEREQFRIEVDWCIEHIYSTLHGNRLLEAQGQRIRGKAAAEQNGLLFQRAALLSCTL